MPLLPFCGLRSRKNYHLHPVCSPKLSFLPRQTFQNTHFGGYFPFFPATWDPLEIPHLKMHKQKLRVQCNS
ncbi:hypothetical protein L596_001933 [Steinernema carpocapsae]|uniref:Uncharacterized protein n=1 Tax=Steinernema carpocapsae TaxID=34508 RepID=A0A4U8UQD0_STECR|nr:hypothetical protein L596_001933 [Steinernema carpocapsae]